MYFNDLDELEDILDSIIPEHKTVFSEEESLDMTNNIMELLYDYIDANPTSIAEPDFQSTMVDIVRDQFDEQMDKCHLAYNYVEYLDAIDDLFEDALELFYEQIIPPRSFPDTFIRHVNTPKDVKRIQKQIDYLASKPQPDQRTPEWYVFRHGLITASNAYKAFESQSNQNYLIYEKCKPINMESRSGFVNVDSPLHWGQKYEPISVMIYEKKYDTQVGDFGCIQHDKYKFIGASPDGINIDQNKPLRFGRMLEIKNIVNREIDGIPKKEYWIQMQLQMETCELEECDFLETRFKEYDDETQFLNDCDKDDNDNTQFLNTEKGDMKGIIMYFSSNEGKPHYVYKPLDMNKPEFEKWEENTMDKLCGLDENGNQQYTWIKNIYWYLDEMSCVLVLRNHKWFRDNISQLAHIWNIIEKERVDGYEHRAPNRKPKKEELPTTNTIDKFFDLGDEYNKKILNEKQTGCLLKIKKIDGDSLDDTIAELKPPKPEPVQPPVIRIRTESFDESKNTGVSLDALDEMIQSITKN